MASELWDQGPGSQPGYDALTVLTRLAQRRPECADWLRDALTGRLEDLAETALDVAIDTGDPMALKLAEALRRHGSVELLRRVQDLCESDRYLFSVPLWEVARLSTEASLAEMRERRQDLNEEEKFDYVIAANNLALRLRYLRRSDAGLRAIEEAVSLCRELAEQDPDRFLPELARTLSNLALLLGDFERQDEALNALQESLSIVRELISKKGDEFLPDLATTLTNLGRRLGRLGLQEDSLRATEEAVEVYRRIAWQTPDPLLSFFATSLHNLGLSLSRMERHEEALAATQEALEIKRRLAEDRPDAFLPDLAASLSSLSRRLTTLGFHEQSLQAVRESFEIRGELVRQRPEIFIPDFVNSLKALGERLSEAGMHDEALQVVREGTLLLTPFCARSRAVVDRRTASALEDYLDLCRSVGETPAEAIDQVWRASLPPGMPESQSS